MQLPNFSTAFYPDETSITLNLAHDTVIVERARFGLHVVLAEIAEDFDTYLRIGNTELILQKLTEYFNRCSLNIKDWSTFDIMESFFKLRELNLLKCQLPFMLSQDIDNDKKDKEEKEVPYSYKGRIWTTWIHKLADAYGWTADYILNLYPEQVICFIQEIDLQKYYEGEEIRVLSELSYSYDKTTKKYTYVPNVMPGWMSPKKKVNTVRVNKKMIPVGIITDLEKHLKQ